MGFRCGRPIGWFWRSRYIVWFWWGIAGFWGRWHIAGLEWWWSIVGLGSMNHKWFNIGLLCLIISMNTTRIRGVFTGLGIDWVSLIGHRGVITVIICHIIDNLHPSVWKSHLVASSCYRGRPFFRLIKISSASVIFHSVCERIRAFLKNKEEHEKNLPKIRLKFKVRIHFRKTFKVSLVTHTLNLQIIFAICHVGPRGKSFNPENIESCPIKCPKLRVMPPMSCSQPPEN